MTLPARRRTPADRAVHRRERRDRQLHDDPVLRRHDGGARRCRPHARTPAPRCSFTGRNRVVRVDSKCQPVATPTGSPTGPSAERPERGANGRQPSGSGTSTTGTGGGVEQQHVAEHRLRIRTRHGPRDRPPCRWARLVHCDRRNREIGGRPRRRRVDRAGGRRRRTSPVHVRGHPARVRATPARRARVRGTVALVSARVQSRRHRASRWTSGADPGSRPVSSPRRPGHSGRSGSTRHPHSSSWPRSTRRRTGVVRPPRRHRAPPAGRTGGPDLLPPAAGAPRRPGRDRHRVGCRS